MNQSPKDRDAAPHLCRRQCEKLDFVMVHTDDTIFSGKIPQKFTPIPSLTESPKQVDYDLARAVETMEPLYNRFLDCACPECQQCMKIEDRQPIHNLTKTNSLNAEQEFYCLERMNVP